MELNVSTENGRAPVTVLHAAGNIETFDDLNAAAASF